MKYPDTLELGKLRATCDDVKAILREAEANYEKALLEACPIEVGDLVSTGWMTIPEYSAVTAICVEDGEIKLHITKKDGGYMASLRIISHLNGEPVE